jgi:hypothetical protein
VGWLVATAMIGASLGLIVFFPGQWTVDSYARWAEAFHLLQIGPFGRPFLRDWYPPSMTLLMALTYKIAGTVVLFTWLQYFYVLLSVLVAFFVLSGSLRLSLVLGCLLMAAPNMLDAWGQVMPDPWTAAALLIAVAAPFLDTSGKPVLSVSLVLMYVLNAEILFGFRFNTFPVITIILVTIFLAKDSWRGRLAWMTALLAGVAASFAIYLLPAIKHVPVIATVMFWESLGVLKVLNDPEAVRQFSAEWMGDTTTYISELSFVYQDITYWGPNHRMDPWLVIDHYDEVKNKWWVLITAHPWAFLQFRLRLWSEISGLGWVSRPQGLVTFASSLNPMVDAALSTGVPAGTLTGMAWLTGLLAPAMLYVPNWVYAPDWFTLIELAAIGALIVVERRMSVVLLYAAAGVVYLGTFYIITTGAQLRYTYPGSVVADVLIFYAVARCLQQLFPRRR